MLGYNVREFNISIWNTDVFLQNLRSKFVKQKYEGTRDAVTSIYEHFIIRNLE